MMLQRIKPEDVRLIGALQLSTKHTVLFLLEVLYQLKSTMNKLEIF